MFTSGGAAGFIASAARTVTDGSRARLRSTSGSVPWPAEHRTRLPTSSPTLPVETGRVRRSATEPTGGAAVTAPPHEQHASDHGQISSPRTLPCLLDAEGYQS